MSRQRTAYIAFAAVLMMGFFWLPPLPVRRLLPVAAIGLVGLAYVADFKAMSTFLLRGQTKWAQLSEMSARVPLWEASISAMLGRSPVIGVGYYAGSRHLMVEMGKKSRFHWQGRLGDSHSGYVEVLLGAGILGGVIMTLLLISMTCVAVRIFLLRGRDPPVFATVALFGTALIGAFTSTGGIHTGPSGFVFWSLTTLIPALAWLHKGDAQTSSSMAGMGDGPAAAPYEKGE